MHKVGKWYVKLMAVAAMDDACYINIDYFKRNWLLLQHIGHFAGSSLNFNR